MFTQGPATVNDLSHRPSFRLCHLCECVGCVTSCVVDVSGADPKSVLCAFYKVGQCMKGDKCKFSHDLSIGRKAEKRSMYEDQRDASENGKHLQRFLLLSAICLCSVTCPRMVNNCTDFSCYLSLLCYMSENGKHVQRFLLLSAVCLCSVTCLCCDSLQ